MPAEAFPLNLTPTGANALLYMKRIFTYILLFFAAASLTSCDSFIYDEEGDCDPYYKVRFRYDKNLKFADAFHVEVHEVTLYVVDDETGKVIWQKHADGPELRNEGYMMDVDVKPGKYTLIAWCGEGHKTSFNIPESEHHSGLQCTLTERNLHDIFPTKEGAAVTKKIGNLYHGKLDAVEFPDKQGTHLFTISLTKDTNDVSIGLGHLSGDPVEDDGFIYTLEEANGKMDFDNSILSDENLTYFAHDQYSAPVEWERTDTRGRASVVSTAGAWGHLRTARLMNDRKAYVKVYNKDKDLVASVNLTSLASHLGYKYGLDEQQYLDYCDDYNVVFLLDDNGRWSNATIYINSWKIVLQDSEL